MPRVQKTEAGFTVVMLGDTFTGKTSLVLRFVADSYLDSARDPTINASYKSKRLTVQGTAWNVSIWDTAGQEQFRQQAPMFYRNAAAAIVCYDITSPQSYDTLKYWMDELQQRSARAGDDLVLAMCATKCDLAHQRSHLDTTQAEELAEAYGAIFMTTSAKTNENVTALFQKVAERVLHVQQQKENDRNATNSSSSSSIGSSVNGPLGGKTSSANTYGPSTGFISNKNNHIGNYSQGNNTFHNNYKRSSSLSSSNEALFSSSSTSAKNQRSIWQQEDDMNGGSTAMYDDDIIGPAVVPGAGVPDTEFMKDTAAAKRMDSNSNHSPGGTCGEGNMLMCGSDVLTVHKDVFLRARSGKGCCIQ